MPASDENRRNFRWFPSSSSHRYTQVRASVKSVVIPAWMPESSAMDGSFVVAQVLD